MAPLKKVGEFVVALGEGTPKQGEKNALSPVYRNVLAKDGFPKLEGMSTLYEMFESSVRRFGDCDCLGWRPQEGDTFGAYKWLTYREVHGKAKVLASALKDAGIKAGEKVGIYASNCPEWMLCILAANRSSISVVPLYDSLGETAVEYTVNHSATALVFVQASKLGLLAKAAPKVKGSLRAVVVWGGSDAAAEAAVKKEGLKLYAWDEFMTLGEKKPAEPVAPKPEDIATIMYTSGTTGNPKGVVITHATLLACVTGLQGYIREVGVDIRPGDTILSYLTLAHIFGRAVEEFCLSVGAAIGYWQGDVKKLTDDITALKPSLFPAVPRVLERIQSGIQGKLKAAPWPARALIGLAMKWKLARIRAGRPVQKASPILDWLLFNRFRAGFGGRVRFIVSGGAPLSTGVAEFLAVALCCPVFQGYGLTETCAASFLALARPSNTGTVGPPTSQVELRFEGSEELGYDPLGTPPKGEICLRGPLMFQGYFQDKKKTDEAFDADGFFHTGDVGELTADGCLRVVDRIKNMFKLAQGEYVAAEHLENKYVGADVVEQIWVYGNSYESFLMAVVVPNKRELLAWAKEQGGLPSDFRELCDTPQAAQYVVEELAKVSKKERLKGFERIPVVVLTSEQFSTDNDLMTPSFKLKRPQLQKHFQKQLDATYEQEKKRLASKSR